MRWRHTEIHKRERVLLLEEQFSAIYAIGDVHGCARELEEAEQRIYCNAEQHSGEKLIVLLGDYVDRGPEAKKVLEALSHPPPVDFTRIALCGNHDDEFAKMYREDVDLSDWLDFAGTATLLSYGIDVRHAIKLKGRAGALALIRELVPEAHISYIEAMPVSLQVGRFLFVHAGVKPGVDLPRQSDRDLMWIREPFLTKGPCLPFVVIHGHTPFSQPDIGLDRIGIDTAAFANGKVAVLKIEQRNYTFL